MPKKHYKREPRYVSLLTVYAPDASALIDNMRYDSCFPATEEESRKIWKLISHERSMEDKDPESHHIVRLIRAARNDRPATADRWRSFCCLVLDERSADAAPFTDEEATNRLKFMRAGGAV